MFIAKMCTFSPTLLENNDFADVYGQEKREVMCGWMEPCDLNQGKCVWHQFGLKCYSAVADFREGILIYSKDCKKCGQTYSHGYHFYGETNLPTANTVRATDDWPSMCFWS